MQKDDTSFSLHRDSDRKHINELHMLIRRDILEGYVTPNSDGRMRKYANTIGFRCKFCKHINREQRVKKSSVHPRTIESIYKSCMRFQRDHIS